MNRVRWSETDIASTRRAAALLLLNAGFDVAVVVER
jgi:hypothetical protein